MVTALCPDGDQYMENGEGAGLNGSPIKNCWTADLTNDACSVEGFPIHPCGLAFRRRVKLNLSEWEKVLEPGDPVLDMHIAEGCPLDYESVGRSLAAAPEFYERYLKKTGFKAFTCGSWLLDDNIGQMQPNGNIARFQKRFHMVPHANSSDWQTKQRVFDDPDVNILEAECSTTLQKAVRAWYESGRFCRHAKGFILL